MIAERGMHFHQVGVIQDLEGPDGFYFLRGEEGIIVGLDPIPTTVRPPTVDPSGFLDYIRKPTTEALFIPRDNPMHGGAILHGFGGTATPPSGDDPREQRAFALLCAQARKLWPGWCETYGISGDAGIYMVPTTPQTPEGT